MYSLPPRQRQMGLGQAKGISSYFSANCEEHDAEVAGRFLDSLGVSAYNTRLLKSEDGFIPSYTVLLASASTEQGGDDPMGQLCAQVSTVFEKCEFKVRRGDYAPLMARVVASLREALPHCANADQSAMIGKLIDSFQLGSIDNHKDASRHWIQDKGPAVESYIGFIESYRDPSGVRGEWEGFVSCVNREVSKKFGVLVDQAETFLAMMPWTAEYEKDVFLRPDFTSLEVLSFGSSGVPAGINIPNYDDIRQSEGFKNVSLGNVLAAGYSVAGDKPVSFLSAADQPLFKSLKSEAFEVQVGIHELLGHGSGKLFHQGTESAEAILGTPHPLGEGLVQGPFYAEGATWDSTFGKIASSYEECRAECAGLYLCDRSSVLEVFGHVAGSSAAPLQSTEVIHPDGTSLLTESDGGANTRTTVTHPDGTQMSVGTVNETLKVKSQGLHDVAYINWLLMARAGLTGLEFYTKETQGWRQAHMQARYVILRVLLEAGQGLLKIKSVTNALDGQADVEVLLDRSLIPTVGQAAIGAFLLKLQVYKSLADVDAGSAMYNAYSSVPPEMVALRDIVMARKEPRKLLVQPHMSPSSAGSGGVELINFVASPVGMVESFVARFPAEDPELMELFQQELTNAMAD